MPTAAAALTETVISSSAKQNVVLFPLKTNNNNNRSLKKHREETRRKNISRHLIGLNSKNSKMSPSAKTNPNCRKQIGNSGKTIVMSSLVSLALVHLAAISLAIVVLGVESTQLQSTTQQNQRHLSSSGDQLIQQVFSPQNQLSKEGQAFDSTPFKSIHEAIRSHPDLREFASLCESKGVKEIIGMDKTPLTVFAPIDRSLGDLLQKSKTRSINLIELAKHHIVQGLVMPDETSKYPLQLNSYAMLSPLYLNQAQQQNKLAPIYINNAKILASHLIQIDAAGDQYQTLHLIDEPLEFAYVNRRTQLRSSTGSTSNSSPSSSSLSSSSSSSRFATVRKPLSLDDLSSRTDASEQAGAIQEFYERFGDLQTNQPLVDLYHVRALRNSNQPQQQPQRIQTPTREQLNLERLARSIRQMQQLRGKLFALNESNTLNTYFLPVQSDELEAILDQNSNNQKLLARALEAHVIPNQVLFTRSMEFGSSFATYQQNGQRVSLNLAKTLPTMDDLIANSDMENLDSLTESISRRLLTGPLELEAKCESAQSAISTDESSSSFRLGLTNAEILVANIPLNNGVLHLIKRPILLTDGLNLMDYLNDNDNQLTDIVSSLGSRSRLGGSATDDLDATTTIKFKQLTDKQQAASKLNRFRELLAKERQILSTFSQLSSSGSNEADSNTSGNKRTILAPTDEAFSRLRFDLRALIEGDDSLIPQHWDSTYRRDLLERLVKRHIITQQTLTSDQLLGPQSALSALSANGQIINFSSLAATTIQVECDSTRAQLIHGDLIGSNGVLHLIDRVLGEEQETIHSLMQSLMLKFAHSRQQLEKAATDQTAAVPTSFTELGQLIELNLRQMKQQQQSSDVADLEQQQRGGDNSLQLVSGGGDSIDSLSKSTAANKNPELISISKTIGQFLDELQTPSNRQKLQLWSQSVNISFQLARLASKAEGQFDDWNDRFKLNDKQFTYFVPNDLAWIRLQQAQPELYKPLVYFLEQQQQQQTNSEQQASGGEAAASTNSIALVGAEQQNEPPTNLPATKSTISPRSSESSHRLLQILERHLVANRRLSERDLNQLDSIQTIGATLRLVDQPRATILATNQQTLTDGSTNQASAFAALHSIIGGGGHQQPIQDQHQHQSFYSQGQLGKSLRLNKASANIVQINETSNGFVYIIDNVLIQPDDADYIVQTSSSSSAISSSMSSLLGAHNSAILDFIQNLFSPQAGQASVLNGTTTLSMLTVIGTLALAILILLIVAMTLVVRRHKQNKLNRHHQLESGLTSSASSANSGSTSTTKSL